QLLYGQRYFLSRFGQLAKVAWLPDSFGFCQQLPQLFKQAGIEVFFTGKLHWNDTNQFPHGIFNWQAPDGTECLTLMSPPNLAGVMDTQPRPMADYGRFWEEQTGLTAMLWLPGVGDHGGGPSRDMWRVKRRWQNSPFFPAIKTGRAEDYVQQLQTESGDKFDNLPIWTEDLYLELHRGCYTTHGEQKNYNRRSDYLLYEAELWSSFAVWFTGAAYPRQELESAWKKVLLNQFHDILPGTSIPEVFEDANADWSQVLQTGEALVNQALEALSSRIQFPAPSRSQAQPFVVFNSLNQTRSEVVAIPYLAQVFDLEGNSLTTQLTPAGETLFACENIPALGYRSYWLLDRSEPERQRETLIPHLPLPPSATLRERDQGDKGDRWILDNGVLKVTLDAATGEIASLYDYRHQRDVLDGNGNQLQFFQDQGQYWDAWNIDPDYENHPLESAELIGAELLENGPLRWRLRVEKSFRDSRFQQDYVLEAQSPLLKIINRVRWQERRVLVKVAFPLSFSADTFTAETPGAVRIRPARPQTPQEKAQWEIPHRQWLDLTNPDLNYGVSLLNDCKYGADAGPNRLRLSLLRGSLWPDPQADWGDCEFTYALLPHGGDWRGAVPVGNQLNCPLRVYCPPCLNPDGPLSPRQSLLNLNNESLGLLALKPREDDPQTWVIRVNDPLGRQSQLNPQAPVPLRVERRLDLLERPLDSVSDRVNPWEIATFQVRLGKEPSALPTV
ncbi:MAG: glycoside hydrolase family 38 C-terminal domain-containing protein, partial [Cyanobacteriota bacterium]|nr:glycoside hydrolase family 38 C-terminal domain-containing protein [Cyanobacteriota bacterium]